MEPEQAQRESLERVMQRTNELLIAVPDAKVSEAWQWAAFEEWLFYGLPGEKPAIGILGQSLISPAGAESETP